MLRKFLAVLGQPISYKRFQKATPLTKPLNYGISYSTQACAVKKVEDGLKPVSVSFEGEMYYQETNVAKENSKPIEFKAALFTAKKGKQEVEVNKEFDTAMSRKVV